MMCEENEYTRGYYGIRLSCSRDHIVSRPGKSLVTCTQQRIMLQLVKGDRELLK
jgi:hypothetical protein